MRKTREETPTCLFGYISNYREAQAQYSKAGEHAKAIS
jgi:hypothetical protein